MSRLAFGLLILEENTVACEQSDAEVKRNYTGKMGAELGEIFHALSNDFQLMCWTWSQYRILFTDKPSRLAIANEAASAFFWVVQKILVEETMLGIARLAGPANTFKTKQNLSLEQLIQNIADPAFQAEMKTEFDSLKTAAEFAFLWRNKHLAHRDLDSSLKRASVSLPSVTLKNIEAVFDSIELTLNKVENKYCHSQTSYRHSPLSGDAEDLLYVIRDGLAYEKLRCKSELGGAPLKEDDQEAI